MFVGCGCGNVRGGVKRERRGKLKGNGKFFLSCKKGNMFSIKGNKSLFFSPKKIFIHERFTVSRSIATPMLGT